MFGIGTSEILIILLIALLVLGPKEIPKVARALGRAMREFQRATDELKHTINSEIEVEEEEDHKIPKEDQTEEKKTINT
jgi:sec-independent protein translocase protein TatB